MRWELSMFAAGADEGPGGPKRITATMTKHIEEEWKKKKRQQTQSNY